MYLRSRADILAAICEPIVRERGILDASQPYRSTLLVTRMYPDVIF
jgi:hypothetical protein